MILKLTTLVLLAFVLSTQAQPRPKMLMGGWHKLDLKDKANLERCERMAGRIVNQLVEKEQKIYVLYEIESCHTQVVAGTNWMLQLQLSDAEEDYNYYEASFVFFQSLRDKIFLKDYNLSPRLYFKNK